VPERALPTTDRAVAINSVIELGASLECDPTTVACALVGLGHLIRGLTWGLRRSELRRGYGDAVAAASGNTMLEGATCGTRHPARCRRKERRQRGEGCQEEAPWLEFTYLIDATLDLPMDKKNAGPEQDAGAQLRRASEVSGGVSWSTLLGCTCLEVRKVLRDLLPSVVHPIDIGDRNLRQLFLSYSFQATDIDAIHLAHGSVVTDAEWPDTTGFTEEVLILLCIE